MWMEKLFYHPCASVSLKTNFKKNTENKIKDLQPKGRKYLYIYCAFELSAVCLTVDSSVCRKDNILFGRERKHFFCFFYGVFVSTILMTLLPTDFTGLLPCRLIILLRENLMPIYKRVNLPYVEYWLGAAKKISQRPY